MGKYDSDLYEDYYINSGFKDVVRNLTASDFNYLNNRKKETKMKNVTKLNKFYVGAQHIAAAIAAGENDDWTAKSYEDAVEHAKQIVESEQKDVAIVVQIVAIVRRQARPVIVQKVK